MVSLDIKIPPTGGTPTLSQATSVSGNTSAALTGNGLEAQPPAISRQLLVSLLPVPVLGLYPLTPPPEPSQGCIPAAQREQDGGHHLQTDQEEESGAAGAGRGPWHLAASDGDGRGACGAQGLPVGPPSSGSVRSSGSRVRNWEPHGGWDSSLLSSFLLLDPTCLPGGGIGMLRGGDRLGMVDSGKVGQRKEQACHLLVGKGKTGDENGWRAGGPG